MSLDFTHRAGSGADYSFNLVPAGQGAVTAALPEDVAQDGCGNMNTAGSFSRGYDMIAPTAAPSSTAPDPRPRPGP